MKRNLLRSLFIPLILFLVIAPAAAQSGPYGNEWIDYSKTYYKFKVGKDGVCRIYRSALNAAGLPSGVSGDNFMLFRDGKEVPVWVSAASMSGSDYIEFWGHKADGTLDKELYLNVTDQPDDRISLFTDTACYYLTYDASVNHLRFAQSANAIPGGSLTPEPYSFATVGFYPRTQYMPGPCYETTADLVSPQFDNGEGYIDADHDIIQSNLTATTTLQAPNLVSGVSGRIRGTAVARSYVNSHEVKLIVNGNTIADSSFGIAEAQHYDASVPASALSGSNQISMTAVRQGSGIYDRFGMSFAELEYPRNFNMSGQDQALLRLPATGAAQYLELTGISGGRLYDLTNGKWYNGNTAVSGKMRFYLDPSFADRQIVVMADAATSVASLAPVKSFQFTNLTAAAAQGDFVIISHPALMQLQNGRKYVEEYANYRKSATGGGHNVITADVTELYDQFAYGYDIHPLSIRHFLQYAYEQWTTKPKDVLLIGRGIFYYEYPLYRSSPGTYQYPVVPVYGVPGSDIDYVMFNGVHTPRMRLGRLSVWNAGEIGVYLNKVQNSEALMPAPAVPTLATEVWKKRAMHIIGSSSEAVLRLLEPVMREASYILADTFTGKKVTSIVKSTNAAITAVNSALVDSLLRSGVSMFTFYGHGSPTAFDYNLPGPETYSNNFRMGSFLGLGCDLSQMFQLSTQKSITERYILAPNAGSTTFMASSNTSYTDLDNYYLNGYYNSVAFKNYGAPIGTHFNFTYDSIYRLFLNGAPFPNSYSTQLECMIFSGDPSLKLPSPQLPDYHVTEEGLATVPGAVTTGLDTFKLRINAYNLGKTMRDTVVLRVEHTNPANVASVVATYTLYNLHYSDTSLISIPIDKTADLGLNKYKVTIDAPNRYAEVSELNNTATLELFISSDNLVPVYPYEFAIVNEQGITLKASTLNPFRPTGRYLLEMDTTELFNSPQKQSTTVNSMGGIIKWKPAVSLTDSTVYYWRTALDSAVGGNIQWTNSSFIYLAKSAGGGWNQSHYYQYLKDYPAGLNLRTDRLFHYGASQIINKLLVKNIVLCNTVTPTTSSCNDDAQHMQNWLNDSRIDQSSYDNVVNGLIITVVDSATGRIWINTPNNTYGASPPIALNRGTYSRQYDVTKAQSRYDAINFLENVVPNGAYVVIKNIYWHTLSSPDYFVDKWKTDTAVLGSGHSLYHTLFNMGFTKIDSFYKERVFIFMRRKADPTLPLYQEVTDSLTQFIEPTFLIKGSDISGKYNSTIVGPAKAWDALKWKVSALDTFRNNDTTSLSVVGIDNSGNETELYQKVTGDTTLSGISAQQYPKLKLIWKSKDSVTLTSPQLAYWRVLYTPVPEAGLNPSAHLAFADTLSQGQMQTFSTAIENLTSLPMDSMLVRYKIIGADGVTRTLADRRYRPLKDAGDTIHASITFDPAPYPGKNLFFVEANPANDQPEQYHPNNLGYLQFRVGVDTHNPLMDVTFDGVHILNGDIVSAKPFIKVKLKDENRFLALNDTGLVSVSLRYPSDSILGSSHPVPFDGAVCRFIPATKTEPVNEAMIEFRPGLIEDGTYQLIVTGMDKSGNGAGGTAGSTAAAEYRISFEVENKPSITNVLNYPNPFSTSTAFVFTLTGSQIPSQFKIQVLSVTGKVVREITRNELGPLHIGRNITEYKWDGRDQFGQLLGNGVYLYRVVTSLNGQDMDLRTDTRSMSRNGGGIDKYFKNGYGKMYIMR